MLNPFDLSRMTAMVNPFDLKNALLARHAQHVVLVHFPIALFIVGVAFDLAALWKNRRAFADAAYFNLSVAAIFTIPVVATGILAWQFALEGQTLKGILRLHLILRAAVESDDLGGLDDAVPGPAEGRVGDSCELANCAGIGGSCADSADGAPWWVPERRKWGSLVLGSDFCAVCN